MDNAVCLHNATVLTGFSVMEKCAVYIKNGKIADVYSEERFKNKKFPPSVKIIDVEEAYVAPGMIDTHMHGIGGYPTNDGDYKSILKISEILPQYGVTSFIPTIGACPEKEMIKSIKAVVKAMGKETGAHILGIHLEGPFLSAERIGGQELNGISIPDTGLIDRLWHSAKGKIINMTVAPELKGMRELALNCISKGIILQAGHTNATYKQMIEGMQVNIMHVTHLFNAMRPLHHREPGVVGAALIHPELSCEIIGDGVHVNPNLIHLLMKSKPLSQLVLITDSFYLAKSKLSEDSEYYFNECFKRKSDNVIIGSGISMFDGLKNLVKYGVPIEKAIRMASANPATIMKQPHKGFIIPGFDADIIIFDKNYQKLQTIISGQFIKEG